MPRPRVVTKYFAKGSGSVRRYRDSDSEILLFDWNGKDDGSARYVPHVNRYVRKGIEYASFAALLRAVEAEHKGA